LPRQEVLREDPKKKILTDTHFRQEVALKSHAIHIYLFTIIVDTQHQQQSVVNIAAALVIDASIVHINRRSQRRQRLSCNASTGAQDKAATHLQALLPSAPSSKTIIDLVQQSAFRSCPLSTAKKLDQDRVLLYQSITTAVQFHDGNSSCEKKER